ncbi:hypothetical protein [Brevibacillus borstelensis]|uniref:hypothetical protein n=1 Tax=Brevibacillus borstelensis TaxID=45462 RepID=UPI001561E515|nr:hypothetical protein [Brevibacillus borstelensis]MBE5395448.1 hypothetical protein [Brevibacillus borstelensis]MED1743411.1 hypothetical protein [Brevibacillus borstelensis]
MCEKDCFLVIATTLTTTPFLHFGNFAHAQALNVNQSVDLIELKQIFDSIEKYKDYYTIDEKGYHLTKEAKNVIPDKTYNLLKDTFEQTNVIFKERENNTIGNKVKGNNTIGDEVSTLGNDEGYTYYAYDKDTYYYEGPNWDVGNWLYISDDDTRWLANAMAAVSAASALASIILSLFPPTKGLAISSSIISLIFNLGATYISNKNKGYGIVVRAYSGGVTLKSRTY